MGTSKPPFKAASLALLLALLLAAGAAVSLTRGSWPLPAGRVAAIIMSKCGLPAAGRPPTPVETAIIWDGRLPRLLTAALVGFALAAAGAVMQGIFRNPMASPGIIGISSGAALGAVLAFYLGLTASFPAALPLMAAIGALATLAAVYLIATSGGRTSIATLLLAGIALNLILGAVTSFVITLSTREFDVGRVIVTWLMGDLNNRLWLHVRIVALTTAAALLLISCYVRDLNLLMLGEEEAANLGVEVNRARNLLLFAASAMTGGAVAVAGVIGFVGLVAPHMVRGMVGADNRLLLPLAGLLGAVFLVYADLLVRLVIPVDLKIGVLTSLLGGPFFIYQIIRYRHRFEFM
ncbi:MAG: iron chelate uptake ABC transporter family permease subunit [Deltaproteobacteria bacterium]|nr:iron chelate uptake ABC transporter family permease subunit [Deltaproteobacteria bacterium]